MNLTEFAKEVHKNAVQHGWWEKEPSFVEIIALCHSELSEALEEYRNSNPDVYYNGFKLEGIAVKLADCILRILDYCGKAGIDIEDIIRRKHEYNKTRPYLHGGKKI